MLYRGAVHDGVFELLDDRFVDGITLAESQRAQ